MKKLKIAQIAPIIERVPPRKYGGTERVVSEITEELVRRGHDVTLFATGDSKTSAKLNSVYPKSIRESNLARAEALDWSMFHIESAYKHADKFDIIHEHNSTFGVQSANISKTPTIVTLHGRLRNGTKKHLEQNKNPYYVSISKDQVKDVNLKRVTTIPHGINFSGYPFGEEARGYLLYVGRITKIKGTDIAIQVAKELNLPLIIAAKLDESDKDYFDKYIKKELNSKIKWVGEVTTSERNKLMSQALCLINPITWREPFGLTMIEAMATGCPVVSFNKGSVPEVMKNGKTGYFVRTKNEMKNAIKKIDKIDRKFCRDYALENFSVEKMVDRYEALYERILTKKDKQDEHYHLRQIERESTPWSNYPTYVMNFRADLPHFLKHKD